MNPLGDHDGLGIQVAIPLPDLPKSPVDGLLHVVPTVSRLPLDQGKEGDKDCVVRLLVVNRKIGDEAKAARLTNSSSRLLQATALS